MPETVFSEEVFRFLENEKAAVFRSTIDHDKIQSIIGQYGVSDDNFLHEFLDQFFEGFLTYLRTNEISDGKECLRKILPFFEMHRIPIEEVFVFFSEIRESFRHHLYRAYPHDMNERFSMLSKLNEFSDNGMRYVLRNYRMVILQEHVQERSTYLSQLEMYKKIIEHMTESVWIGDEQERTIYANPNFCNLLGYKLEEMIGRESYDFWEPESAKTVQNNNQIRKKGQASRYEGLLLSKTGETIPVLLSGTPIPGGGTVGIMTDLRELNSLKEAQDELKHLNSMKDEFLSLVGHELRTPLTAIKGYLSMILDGDMGVVEGMIRKALDHSLESTNRLLELVNDMLDLTKIESGTMQYYLQPSIIHPILHSVYSDTHLIAEARSLKIVLDVDPELRDDDLIYVDPNKLKQVFINLLGNAIKFTPENGTITLRAKKLEGAFLFEVQDTGVGIPEDKLDRIYDKFYQVESYIHRTVE